MKKPPMVRRHLGDYQFYLKDGTPLKVAVYVNAVELGARLAKRAHKNKSLRAKMAGGAVLVEALVTTQKLEAGK